MRVTDGGRTQNIVFDNRKLVHRWGKRQSFIIIIIIITISSFVFQKLIRKQSQYLKLFNFGKNKYHLPFIPRCCFALRLADGLCTLSRRFGPNKLP